MTTKGGVIGSEHVNAARQRWERALDHLRELTDPSHPSYRSFHRAAPPIVRQTAEREEVVRMARIEYDELQARLATQESRARAAREEELLRRRVLAEEETARHAALQTTLARRPAPPMQANETNGEPMNEMARRVQAKDEDRLRVLQAVYEMVNARPNVAVPMAAVYEKAGLDQERGRDASRYLEAEGLLMGEMGHRLSITHAGVNEAEHTLRKPTEATAHFSSIVVNQVFNGAVGAVQTGAGAVANVQQALAPPAQRETALAELDAAAEKVEDPAKREQAIELARAVREEMQRPAPSATKVTAYIQLMTALAAPAPTLEHLLKALFGG